MHSRVHAHSILVLWSQSLPWWRDEPSGKSLAPRWICRAKGQGWLNSKKEEKGPDWTHCAAILIFPETSGQVMVLIIYNRHVLFVETDSGRGRTCVFRLHASACIFLLLWLKNPLENFLSPPITLLFSIMLMSVYYKSQNTHPNTHTRLTLKVHQKLPQTPQPTLFSTAAGVRRRS